MNDVALADHELDVLLELDNDLARTSMESLSHPPTIESALFRLYMAKKG